MDDMEQAERLANTYADAILRLSYTYLKNTHDAQDICQTVFVKLLMEPREFKSPEHERVRPEVVQERGGEALSKAGHVSIDNGKLLAVFWRSLMDHQLL